MRRQSATVVVISSLLPLQISPRRDLRNYSTLLVRWFLVILGTRGAVLHHSAETVLYFRKYVKLLCSLCSLRTCTFWPKMSFSPLFLASSSVYKSLWLRSKSIQIFDHSLSPRSERWKRPTGGQGTRIDHHVGPFKKNEPELVRTVKQAVTTLFEVGVKAVLGGFFPRVHRQRRSAEGFKQTIFEWRGPPWWAGPLLACSGLQCNRQCVTLPRSAICGRIWIKIDPPWWLYAGLPARRSSMSLRNSNYDS